MVLTRVVIETNKFQAKGRKETIEASTEEGRIFFNPSEYQVQRRVDWKELEGRSLTTPQLQFEKGGPRTLSLTLVFDTYERREDVRKFTGRIARLAEIEEGVGRPPVCTITWGHAVVNPYAGLPFTGVLESLTQKFTLFLEDGRPVRATLDLQFKEGEPPGRQFKRTPPPRSSPLQAKVRVVRQGDSVWGLAAAEYGDPARWRLIAEANRILNPRALVPGQVLILPAVE
jgi:hypothetical protein